LRPAALNVLTSADRCFQYQPTDSLGESIPFPYRADLVKGLTQTGADTPVAAAMTSHFDCAAPSEMLEGAVQRLKASGCPALPVLRDRELVGVLTMENVGEFLMVHSALRANRARAAPVA
jgi:CBS-domain-containing membrane protein